MNRLFDILRATFISPEIVLFNIAARDLDVLARALSFCNSTSVWRF